MGKVIVGLSVSLDGFIAGADDGPGKPLGEGGEALFAWMHAGPERNRLHPYLCPPDASLPVVRGWLEDCGAMISGRRTFDIANGWGGDHHGVPIFVLTRRAPDGDQPDWPLVTYVTDVETAMARAKAAAGDSDVLVHGARTAQLALAAGVLDELEIHQIPVLLGQGRRLFDGLPPEHIELELTRVVDGPGVTHLRYRVRR